MGPGERAAYANGFDDALDKVQQYVRVCQIAPGAYPVLLTLDKAIDKLRRGEPIECQEPPKNR